MTNTAMPTDRVAFERWFYASKYAQVVIPNKGTEQTAWDAWQAALAASPATTQAVHSDHPLRHWDRTCPACIAEKAEAEPAAPAQPVMIDTGDHVLHRPSGEHLLVAFVEGEHLCACGWPETLAKLSDCTLVKRASAESTIDLLHELARSTGRRASYAKERLAAQEKGSFSSLTPDLMARALHQALKLSRQASVLEDFTLDDEGVRIDGRFDMRALGSLLLITANDLRRNRKSWG